MIRLIGTRCTDSNVFSQGVLIVRFLLGNVEIIIVAFTAFSFQVSYAEIRLGVNT